jgi:hypothetical protein
VILTTNESRESLCNTGDAPRGVSKEDAKRGIIQTNRDSSFKNRLTVVYFDPLSQKNTCDIVENLLQKKLEQTREIHKVNITYRRGLPSVLSATVEQFGGMHHVGKCIDVLLGELVAQAKRQYREADIDISKKQLIIYSNKDGALQIKEEGADYTSTDAEITFQKPQDWQKAYAYVYKTKADDSTEEMLQWPGLPMQGNADGTTYELVIPAEFFQDGDVRVIFNGGKGQPQIPDEGASGFLIEVGQKGYTIQNTEGIEWKTETMPPKQKQAAPPVAAPPVAAPFAAIPAEDLQTERLPIATHSFQPVPRERAPKQGFFGRFWGSVKEFMAEDNARPDRDRDTEPLLDYGHSWQ